MMGATQNSHSCSSAQPPTKMAGAVLRAGFTDVFVTMNQRQRETDRHAGEPDRRALVRRPENDD
jgi:hypothetical protein